MALTTTELAEFTKRARELMNDGGEHWMKGEYKQWHDSEALLRYCSIGAIRETLFDGVDDVDINDPQYKRIVKALATAVRDEVKEGRYEPPLNRRDVVLALAGDHEGIVIDFNDHDMTTWQDVERVFKRAEVLLAA